MQQLESDLDVTQEKLMNANQRLEEKEKALQNAEGEVAALNRRVASLEEDLEKSEERLLTATQGFVLEYFAHTLRIITGCCGQVQLLCGGEQQPVMILNVCAKYSRQGDSNRSLTERNPNVDQFYSWATKGLAMASMPSTGQINTTAVPLQTTRPRVRVSSVSLNGSSGSLRCSMQSSRTIFRRGSKLWY